MSHHDIEANQMYVNPNNNQGQNNDLSINPLTLQTVQLNNTQNLQPNVPQHNPEENLQQNNHINNDFPPIQNPAFVSHDAIHGRELKGKAAFKRYLTTYNPYTLRLNVMSVYYAFMQ